MVRLLLNPYAGGGFPGIGPGIFGPPPAPAAPPNPYLYPANSGGVNAINQPVAPAAQQPQWGQQPMQVAPGYQGQPGLQIAPGLAFNPASVGQPQPQFQAPPQPQVMPFYATAPQYQQPQAPPPAPIAPVQFYAAQGQPPAPFQPQYQGYYMGGTPGHPGQPLPNPGPFPQPTPPGAPSPTAPPLTNPSSPPITSPNNPSTVPGQSPPPGGTPPPPAPAPVPNEAPSGVMLSNGMVGMNPADYQRMQSAYASYSQLTASQQEAARQQAVAAEQRWLQQGRAEQAYESVNNRYHQDLMMERSARQQAEASLQGALVNRDLLGAAAGYPFYQGGPGDTTARDKFIKDIFPEFGVFQYGGQLQVLHKQTGQPAAAYINSVLGSPAYSFYLAAPPTFNLGGPPGGGFAPPNQPAQQLTEGQQIYGGWVQQERAHQGGGPGVYGAMGLTPRAVA